MHAKERLPKAAGARIPNGEGTQKLRPPPARAKERAASSRLGPLTSSVDAAAHDGSSSRFAGSTSERPKPLGLLFFPLLPSLLPDVPPPSALGEPIESDVAEQAA